MTTGTFPEGFFQQQAGYIGYIPADLYRVYDPAAYDRYGKPHPYHYVNIEGNQYRVSYDDPYTLLFVSVGTEIEQVRAAGGDYIPGDETTLPVVLPPGPTVPGPTVPGPTVPGPTVPGPTVPGPAGPSGDLFLAAGAAVLLVAFTHRRKRARKNKTR